MNFYCLFFKLKFLALVAVVFLCCSGCVTPQNMAADSPPVEDPAAVRSEKDVVAEAYRLYTAASLALSERDFGKASSFLSRAVELDPSSAHLCVSLARVYRQSGDMEAALAQGLECARLHVESPEVYVFLGDLHATGGDDETAAEHYSEALRLGSLEDQRLRLMLANLSAKQGRYREALENLEIILEKNPDHPVAEYFRGRIHLQLKEYPEAEASLLAAIESSGNIGPVLFDLGTLYQITGRTEEAVEIFESLLTLRPDDTAALERIITLYVDLGKHELAEQYIKRLKEVTEKGELQRQVIGLVYLKQGRYDRAIEELEAVVKEEPDDSKSRHYLATAYQQAGDTDRAISHFNRVPEDSVYYFNSRVHIALIYNDLEQRDQAVTVLQQLREAGETRSELYLILSTLFEQQEKYDDAEAVVHEGLV
ncbi:MAG TPA: tetratricopeptide repeat protein, partial [Desulfobacteraceae bacterium]|nr:tetratricopeptide repeat protein [Desulfobacteraceae bacterium]